MVGGVALIIGLATKLISALFGLLMIVATLKVKLLVGLFGNGQMAGYELDLAFLAIAAYLVINGSKMFSINQLIFNKDNSISKSI
ncbi:hypothetical protein LPC09_13495 [Metabacillus sp. B2-18]|nr:hypothetical protein LPC09_13495 [Metabacillus sp. B2-18]